MSTIYSAGQFDDAFSPKRLGNWESGAKEPCYLGKSRPFSFGGTRVIVDEKGHLLPGVPRNKSTAWGLLQYYMKTKTKGNMAVLSGPGKQQHSAVEKRMKKLPRYIPKKTRGNNREEDMLLSYIKELKLPIVWIIGPPTKNINQKRKQFSKQLASYLRFGYVSLDEKIQEWKDRQTTYKCNILDNHHNKIKSNTNNNPDIHGVKQALSATSIAPSKLPTCVPPHISPNLVSPRSNSSMSSSSPYPEELLSSSQRITFDAALPIERNKILELYKFAMVECLPCEGFVCDTMPFDLVEGLAFEKSFYPATLAIYFAEGIPQKKKPLKPRDRRITAGSMPLECTIPGKPGKKMISPLEYFERCKKAANGETVYMRAKSHRRLGSFSTTEGEKICKQYGSKTIRIINAEDVDRDTMEFLNELVKKNLDKFHQQTMDGNVQLDCTSVTCGPPKYLPSSPALSVPAVGRRMISSPSISTKYTYASSFIPEEDEDKEPATLVDRNDTLPDYGKDDKMENTATLTPSPIHATSQISDTSISIFSIPSHLFQASIDGNITSPTRIDEKLDDSCPPPWTRNSNTDNRNVLPSPYNELGGGGDQVSSVERKEPLQLFEKINKLESTVVNLNPEENHLQKNNITVGNHRQKESEQRLPPPTAFEDEENEEETLTSVIRRAIARQNLAGMMAHLSRVPHHQPAQQQRTPNQVHDYGASGDFAVNDKPHEVVSDDNSDEVIEIYENPYGLGRRKGNSHFRNQKQRRKEEQKENSNDEDQFYN